MWLTRVDSVVKIGGWNDGVVCMINDPRRERFCQEYVVDFNAVRASIRAGYSERSAYSISNKLMKRMDVQVRIEQLKFPIMNEIKLRREDVINELRRVGFSDVRKLFNDSRGLTDLDCLDDDTAAAIESIEVVANTQRGEVVDYTHKIKMSNKLGALKELAKHFNIYEDHQKAGAGEITVNIEGKDSKL